MAAAASGAAAALIQASRASGVIVKLDPGEFAKVLRRSQDPLVVFAEGGVFRKNYQYLTSYRGLAFFTKSDEPLTLPQPAEIVQAERIWIPG